MDALSLESTLANTLCLKKQHKASRLGNSNGSLSLVPFQDPKQESVGGIEDSFEQLSLSNEKENS